MRKMLAVGGCVGALLGRLIDKKQRICIPLLFESDSLTSARDSDMRLPVSVLAFGYQFLPFVVLLSAATPKPSTGSLSFFALIRIVLHIYYCYSRFLRRSFFFKL